MAKQAKRDADPERHQPPRTAEANHSRRSGSRKMGVAVTLPDNVVGPRHDSRGLAPGASGGSRIGPTIHGNDTAHVEGPARGDPQPQAHRPRSGSGTGERRARASRARRPAPAITARASASRAVRCRCSAASRRRASRTRSARRSSRSTSARSTSASAAGIVDVAALHGGGPGPAQHRDGEDPRRGRADQEARGQGVTRSRRPPRRRSRRPAARPRSSAAEPKPPPLVEFANVDREVSHGVRVFRTSARFRSCGGGSCSRWRCWRSIASACSSRRRA